MAVEMTIDNVPISIWKFILTDTQGEQDGPAIKRPYFQNWNDRHGVDIDLTTTILEPLHMQLTFLIRAISFSQYRSRLNAFKKKLQRPGLHVIKYPNLGDLPYFAFQSDIIRVERLTTLGAAVISAKVYLSLTVPYPVGRFFTINAGTVSFRISCTTPMLIDWGDGTSAFAEGANQLFSHTYSTFTYVGILGNIEDITSLTNIVGMLEIVEV